MLPDGAVKEGVVGVTSPMDIAVGISKGLAKKALVSRRDPLPRASAAAHHLVPHRLSASAVARRMAARGVAGTAAAAAATGGAGPAGDAGSTARCGTW